MVVGQLHSLRPGEDLERLRACREYAAQRCAAAAAALDRSVATLKLAREGSLVSVAVIDRVRQAAADYKAWHEEVEELDRSIGCAESAGPRSSA